jgi:hypothetical protein
VSEFLLSLNGFTADADWPGAMVASGVALELTFGFRGTHLQGVLTARSKVELGKAVKAAGEANERAANAELRTAEIERLTAWRHISPEQRDAIATEVGKIGSDNIDLLVEWQNGDAEAFMYSRELIRAFVHTGVTKIRWLANSHVQATWFGLNWAASDERIDLELLRELLPPIQAARLPIDLSRHLGRTNPPSAPNLYVFVGPKPPAIDVEAELAEAGIVTPKTSDSSA